MTAAFVLRDEAMRQERPEDHIGLACMIAQKFTTMRPIEDSEQFADAMVGLMKAIKTFDPNRGFQFSTYAWHVIRRQIWTGHRARCKHATRQEHAFLEDIKDSGDYHAWIETSDQISTMLAKVDILPPREQAVIRARLRGMKFREIAEALGCSKQRVQQLEDRATRMLRCMMAEAGAIG